MLFSANRKRASEEMDELKIFDSTANSTAARRRRNTIKNSLNTGEELMSDKMIVVQNQSEVPASPMQLNEVPTSQPSLKDYEKMACRTSSKMSMVAAANTHHCKKKK